MEEIIKKAISEKRELAIRYMDLDFDVHVNPYIYGDDLFQQTFVWGWIEHNGTCFKFYLDRIKELKMTSKKFEVEKGVEYYYSAEESHWAFVEGIPHYVNFKGNLGL